MNKSLIITLFFLSIIHLEVTGETVSLYCEVPTENTYIESTYMGEQIPAERHEDGTFRVEEETYARLLDSCDRRNKYSGKILPSIIATSGYSMLPYGSTTLPLGSKSRKANYAAAKANYNQIKRDPEKTMVVFFHGTGSNPIKDIDNKFYPNYDEEKGGGELLSFLQSRMKENGAEEGLDYISLHGVGSGNLQVTNLHTKFMAKDSYVWLGTVAGSGTSENVENAMLHLKGITNNPCMEEKMAQQGESIKRVGKLVVVGWSRGSVTAIQFAHDLYKDPELKDINVHLFVVDPVPGLGNVSGGYWKNIFYLTPNVKSYFGAYAQDERSFGFTPLVPRVSDETNRFSDSRKAMVVAEFPGGHATLVGNTWDKKDWSDTARRLDSFAALARVVRGLAQTFIVSHSGNLSGVEYEAGRPSKTLDEIAVPMQKDFDHVLNNMSEFISTRKDSYTGKVQTLSDGRKYHQDWNVFGNYKILNDKIQNVMPRYTASDIKGFKLKYNFNKNGERRFVNHFHKVLTKSLAIGTTFDVTEFFNPSYYKKYRSLIIDKIEE